MQNSLNACPQCHKNFTPRRSNQKYCSNNCKTYFNRKDRANEYLEERRKDAERVHDLTDSILRNHRPEDRGQFFADLIVAAINGNRGVMRALQYRGYLKISNEEYKGYPSIGRQADRICRYVYGKGLSVFLNKHELFDPQPLLLQLRYLPPPPKPDGWDYRALLGTHKQVTEDMAYAA